MKTGTARNDVEKKAGKGEMKEKRKEERMKKRMTRNEVEKKAEKSEMK